MAYPLSRRFWEPTPCPREFKGRADEYIDTVVIPSLNTLASEDLVDAVDAFSETVGFSVAQTKRVFDRAAC